MKSAIARYEPAPLPAAPPRSYTGTRRADGATHVTRFMAGSGSPLDPRLDLRNHSPTGFEWGYGGSGPAQLALALCADALGDDRRALQVYQQFKFAVVENLPKAGWTLTAREVIERVNRLIIDAAASAPQEITDANA